MSSCNRRTFLLSSLALAGCGFEPVYGTGGAGRDLRGSILVDEPGDRRSFTFVEHLERRLGRADAPRYALSYDLSVTEEGLAISGSNNITRYNVLGTAKFQVKDQSSGSVIYDDSVNAFTSYSASEQPVATLSAERDAEERLMVVLGDKITAKLLSRAGLFSP